MKKYGIALLLTWMLPLASHGAEKFTTQKNHVCREVIQVEKGIHVPEAVWQSVKQGQPSRLLVVIEDSDLSTLTRQEQLDAYQNRKKIIFQSLPIDGARLLRPFDQLPIFEIELTSPQALRSLMSQCLVKNIYLDQEEPPLRSREAP